MTPFRFITFLSVVLVLTCTVPAFAQEAAPAAKRAQVEAKMKQIRSRMLREQVGLSEAKVRQVEAILEKHQRERRTLRQQVQQERLALTELLSQDSDDQQAYARHIQAMRDAHRKLQSLRDGEITELQKVLTPKEQAQLGIAMAQMRRQMNQAIGRHRGGGPPPR